MYRCALALRLLMEGEAPLHGLLVKHFSGFTVHMPGRAKIGSTPYWRSYPEDLSNVGSSVANL
jgi:hypothetical protein